MRAVFIVIGLSFLIFANYVEESAADVAVAGGGRGRSSDHLGDNVQCKPGSRFRQKCNWCTCSSQGLKGCTKKGCRPGADYSSEPQCEGDAMFTDEENCNWCSCHNGIAACTEKLCFSGGQRGRAVSDYPPEPQPVRCLLPADSGPCEALVWAFRFNSETDRCEEFEYGGCQGNDNRFDTPEECQQTCGGSTPIMSLTWKPTA